MQPQTMPFILCLSEDPDFFFNREVNVPFTCRKALYVTEKTIIKGGVLHFLTLHQDNLLLRTMMIPDVWIKYESETFG